MSRIMEELIKETYENACEENSKEIALKMINVKKLSLEEVAEISGLQLDEVKKLAKKADMQ